MTGIKLLSKKVRQHQREEWLKPFAAASPPFLPEELAQLRETIKNYEKERKRPIKAEELDVIKELEKRLCRASSRQKRRLPKKPEEMTEIRQKLRAIIERK